MSEAEKLTRVVQVYEQPVQIDLIRNAKGHYHWKIQIRAESPLSALRMVQDVDAELRHRFAEAPGPNPSPSPSASVASHDPYARMEKAIEGAKRAGEKTPF